MLVILRNQIQYYYELNKHLLEIDASQKIKDSAYQRYIALLELEALYQQEVEQ
tara:strand:- start:299 stop:457 length:159 start_codon:yes stop_codon:yes gene_type:complete